MNRPALISALRSVHPVWWLNGMLVIAASALGVLAAGSPAVTGPPLAWFLVALGIAAAERWPVHLQFQRSAHTFSLTDIPIALALVFASSTQALVGVGVGAAVAFAIRRQSPIKYVFNVAVYVLGLAACLLAVHGVAGAHPVFGPLLWVAIFLATQLKGLMTIVLLASAMSLADGRLSREAVREMFGMDAVVTVVNTSFALVGSVLAVANPRALPILAVPVVIALLGYRNYVREHERHKKVEFLYQANRDLSESPEVAVAMEGLLRRAREAFRAERAEIILSGADGVNAMRTRLGPGEELERLALIDPATAIGLRALAAERPSAFNDTVPGPVANLCAPTEIRNAMVAVLRGKEKVIGTMVITNRVGLTRGFTPDDLILFETLAANASAALQFDRLEQAVAELRDLQHQLHHQAYHDPLTGLANRALFTRRLDAALEQGEAVTVLFIDLDDFKSINDTLGHGVGDQLLCAASGRISGCVRGDELVARLGGDEFAILAAGAPAELESLGIDIARRLVSVFELPVNVGERLIGTRLSVGVATTDHSGRHTADLLRDADVAMYEAKSQGKGRYALFTPLMRESVMRRHIVKEELRSAVDEERLCVQYQPIVDIRTGDVAAVEALVRWEHPERGRIPPLEFVPLAEASGLIVPLGRHVLSRACWQAVQWKCDTGRPVCVQVNLSARELDDPELLTTVADVLDQTGLDPSCLILEVTESVMIEDAASGGLALGGLRDLGVGLALDDFGTGYSSLSYLRSLPLDSLKIAKEFVDGLAHSEEDRTFVRLIIELARTRGLRVVAEGIEDAEQLNILRSLGCDLGQGYYFAHPLDADDAELIGALAPHPVPSPVTA